jgi:integrase
MPKVAKQLSDAAVRKLKHPGKTDKPKVYAVGGVPGLMIQITPAGAKSWLLRVSIGGRVRHMGLGSYSTVGLADARDAARKAHQAIREGGDPIAERKAAKQALKAAEAKQRTFREAAEKYHKDVKAPALRNERSRKDWLSTMERHAFPVMGELQVAAIERRHVLEVLKPIWPRPFATVLRGEIEAVLGWSAVHDYRPEGYNPAEWRNLKHGLTKPGNAHKVKHHPALPYGDAPAFMQELRALGTTAAQALEFLILTAARSGEVRHATWDEIDLAGKLWTVPGERIKAGKTHRVPLSGAAIQMLQVLPHREGLLFAVPGRGRRKAIMRALYDFELTALHLDRRVKPDGRGGWKLTDEEDGRSITVHGHRSAFKDWARVCTSYADEVSELALAHVNSDSTRAAYARDELLAKREKLMQAWARYLETGPAKAATVTKIGKGRA